MSPRVSGKTRVEARHKAAIYWQKAQRFAHAAHVNAGQRDWDPAVANAVNAVINLSDAICIHYMGTRSASDSHPDALNLLATAADLAPEVRLPLMGHLEALLSVKNIAQYEGRLLDRGDAEQALKHMDRSFQTTSPVAINAGWRAAGPGQPANEA